MLAIVRAIERFHIYLYGIEFSTIVTNCNALVYAINKANLNPRIARWTLLLQNYTFNVTHRPSKKMTHVDALSRQILFVQSPPLERELEFRQLQDPRLREIAYNLEYKEDKNFELLNGLVYRKSADHSRFAVLEEIVIIIIRTYHDESTLWTDKTLQGIQQTYWFPSMQNEFAVT